MESCHHGLAEETVIPPYRLQTCVPVAHSDIPSRGTCLLGGRDLGATINFPLGVSLVATASTSPNTRAAGVHRHRCHGLQFDLQVWSGNPSLCSWQRSDLCIESRHSLKLGRRKLGVPNVFVDTSLEQYYNVTSRPLVPANEQEFGDDDGRHHHAPLVHRGCLLNRQLQSGH